MNPSLAPYQLTPGRLPLLVSLPHMGTLFPPAMAAHMTPEDAALTDTDRPQARACTPARPPPACVRPKLSAACPCTCQGASWSRVVNGRFKGGYITRHHGQPDQGVQCIQLELCQCIYMDEAAPIAFLTDYLAGRLKPDLQAMLREALNALSEGARK